MTHINPDLNLPEDDPVAAEVASVVQKFLEEHDATYTGGCRAFYSPAAWAARGELYGLRSLLVVVHDGGAHARYFAWEYERYDAIEALRVELEKHGWYAEQCTTWYSAIYPI